MVLDHVAQRPGAVVEGPAAAFHAHRLGGRDLHVIDELPVQQRLEDRVAEAEGQQVLHRFLAQVMVDAVDLVLVELLEYVDVQRLRRRQVAAERLLDDHAFPGAAHRARSPCRRSRGYRRSGRRNRDRSPGKRAGCRAAAAACSKSSIRCRRPSMPSSLPKSAQ